MAEYVNLNFNSKAHPVFYHFSTGGGGGLSQAVKLPGREHSPSSRAEVKNS